MSAMNNKCPKCGKKLSPLYMKQNCPHCGVNLLYYKIDEQLEADAEKAEKETTAVRNFLLTLKKSSIDSPLLILRLILFFTPLASMCLPMFWAGHKKVSLITFIMSIINHGFDVGAMAKDLPYLFAVLSIIMVIVLSLAVIINSLFSYTKNGFRRNIIFSLVNTAVFGGLSVAVCALGARAMAGFYVTMAIYLLEFVLHCVTAQQKSEKRTVPAVVSSALCIAFAVVVLILSPKPAYQTEKADYSPNSGEVSVVTFNVAGAFGTDFEDTDSMERCKRFADYMNRIQPDSIGTQEINTLWLDELEASMSDYEAYGVKRGGDSEEKNSEMNAVLWRRDKYNAVNKHTIWLSETPEKESKYTFTDENGEEQEAGCNRVCTYVVLENRETKRMYIHMNTHLDNSSEQAANFGAQVIVNEINKLRAQYGSDVKIVLTGDFNQDENGTAYKTVQAVLTPCDNTGIGCTYQEWGYCGTGDEPIDFIFSNGTFDKNEVLDNISSGYVSDHYGRFNTIKLY